MIDDNHLHLYIISSRRRHTRTKRDWSSDVCSSDLSGLLKFASAGHEPGFIYRNETNEFEEIKAKGLVLGVLKNTAYRQYELTLKKGDMIVLLTDGVTECRWEDRFVN